MKKELKHITINRETIENLKGGYWNIVEPMFYTGNIYSTYAEYEKSLQNFTLEQRYLFAINWLESEVFNGGFNQFFDNSTGIVWEDAYKGFQAIGAKNVVALMEKILSIYGENPSYDREKRWEILEKGGDDLFDKLDECTDEYFAMEDEITEQIILWIKANAEKFYFDGKCEVF